MKYKEEGVFATLDKDGNMVTRWLKDENEFFNMDDYKAGFYDSYNYLYHENFDYHGFDSKGSDYLRYGCQIEKGMHVLDIGANIGAFARYVRTQGADKVYCFEPLTPTYKCLLKNTEHDDAIETFNVGVSDSFGFHTFNMHTDFTHNGGGSMTDFKEKSLDMHYSESCITIGIAEIFKEEKFQKCQFLKMDIEGAEEIVLKAMPDAGFRTLACMSFEFHRNHPDFDNFQQEFVTKCHDFGFKSFTLYHGNGDLRTLTFWRE